MSLLLYLILLLFGALFSTPTPTPVPDPSTEYTVRSVSIGEERLQLPVATEAGFPEQSTMNDGECETPVLDVDLGGDWQVRLALVPADCEQEQSGLGNGTYGYFRTVDDIPDATPVDTISTPLGNAELVTYPYYECTNSCTEGRILTAIITLDDPADPDHPTLQVFAPSFVSDDGSDLNLADYLTQIVPE